MWLFQLWSLIVPPDDAGTSTVPNHLPEALDPNEVIKQDIAIDENNLCLRSTLSATVILLRGVRDTTNGFVPLKSVAGSLCLILENCEVWPPLCTFSLQCL